MDAFAGPSTSKPKRSKPKPSDLLKYTWFIQASYTLETPVVIFEAGAICVHRDGYLVTVTHGTTFPTFNTPPTIQARRQHETLRSVDVVMNSPCEKFGLLLLKVEKTTEEEKFEPFPIQSDMPPIDLRKTIPIHAFICQNRVPFSYVNGNTSYLYPNNLRFPIDDDDDSTFTYDGNFTGRMISSFTKEPQAFWFNPGDISRRKDRQYLGSDLFNACERLDGSIPLLQVSGLDQVTLDGQIGWPVFTEDNKLLLGLIFLPTRTRQFVIPYQIVQEAFRRSMQEKSRKT